MNDTTELGGLLEVPQPVLLFGFLIEEPWILVVEDLLFQELESLFILQLI